MHEQFGYGRTVSAEPDFQRLAGTIGDATRIRMLMLLMEGRALTAKELAYGAGVQPATATAHLQRLLRDRVIAVAVQGRHKYFHLASSQIGQLLELMLVVAPHGEARTPPPSARGLEAIRVARFCYDHLAGQLGTRIAEVLLARGLLRAARTPRGTKELTLTRDGEAWFDELGVNLDAARRSRRRFALRCLDWSERRDHLAGSLGAALAARLVELGWLARRRDSRVVAITGAGRDALMARFRLCFEGAAA